MFKHHHDLSVSVHSNSRIIISIYIETNNKTTHTSNSYTLLTNLHLKPPDYTVCKSTNFLIVGLLMNSTSSHSLQTHTKLTDKY